MTDIEERLRRTLRVVAEQPIDPDTEPGWASTTPLTTRRLPRRLLVGTVAVALAISVFALAIAYGPRTSVNSAASHRAAVIPRQRQGTLQAPGTTTPTEGIMLGPDGLGVVEVGEHQSDAVTAMTRQLGAPTASTPAVCPGRTEVEWHDLSLEFSKGVLAGYRYVVGHSSGTSGPGNPLIKTAAGATLGMTLGQVRPLYSTTAFSFEQGGSIVVPGMTVGDRLFLLFGDNLSSTPLTEIKGGAPCGDF